MQLASVASGFVLAFAVPSVALAQYGTPQPGAGSSATPYGQQPQYGTGQPQYGQPAYGQPQPASQVQAGGLAPPPSAPRDPESWKTEQSLDTAEKKDAGRGLEWFWINAEAGFQHLGLQTFKDGGLVDGSKVPTTGTGPIFGGGLGLRLMFITIGPRFRYASLSRYALWTLDAEVAMRFPLGRLEPYVDLAGGYVRVDGFDGDVGGTTPADLRAGGVHVRGGGGLDYYLTPTFSVGANLSLDLYALSRSAVSGGQGVYATDGSSIGTGLGLTAVAGLHF
jgi:hypothetical protein